MIPPIEQVVIEIPNGAGGYDPLLFDVCITESHTLTNTLTDHPVEQGANIVDHSRPEPRTVTLEIVASNTPLNQSVGPDYASGTYGQLLALYLNPKLCRLTTTRAFYPSMGLTSCVTNVDVKSANALRAATSWKEVRVVQNRFVKVVVVRDPKAQRKNKRGAVTTTLQKPGESLGRQTEGGIKKLLGRGG